MKEVKKEIKGKLYFGKIKWWGIIKYWNWEAEKVLIWKVFSWKKDLNWMKSELNIYDVLYLLPLK